MTISQAEEEAESYEDGWRILLISCWFFKEKMIIEGLLDNMGAREIVVLSRICGVISTNYPQLFDLADPSRHVY